MTNPYGDIELDVRGMRALAHPVRLAILSRLQGHGPSTATALAPHVGATPSVTSWHLRHLAEHGLVRDSDVESDGRQRWWEAVGTGIRFTASADDGGQDAASLLSRTMFDQAEPLPRAWAREVEPLLEPEWRRSAGLSNTTIVATPDELDGLEAAIEQLLAPFVLRKSGDGSTAADPGEGADPAGDDRAAPRRVRLLRYVLPSGPDEAS